MKKLFLGRTQEFFLCSVVFFAFIINGCFSVKLIADYDEAVDKQVTEIYRNISTYMQDLANTPQVSGTDSIARVSKYNSVQLDISTLKLRASDKDKNSQQIQQIELLVDSWNKIGELQKLHPTKDMIQSAQSGFEITLTAILKLEIAKKRS
ncbi:MAG: hypothetical protein ABSD46_06465 [Bacteroidota bacterium]